MEVSTHALVATATPSSRWTSTDVARLIELWTTTELSNAEIAKKLGRKEAAVAVKASRINLPRRAKGPAKAKGAKIRNCLRCSGPFHSTGAGNRFCDPCKESSDWQNGSDCFMAVGI